MADNWHTGNAYKDGSGHRGWLLGHFIEPAGSVRSTPDLEVKWGTHPKGERRQEWVTGEVRTTLLLLVQGRFTLELSTGTTTLEEQGDYVVWGPGIDHCWHAEEDSVVVTVRWPSVV